MSPHVHALPAPENFGSVGEYEFAQRLQTICGSDTHLWFRLDYIPGTREIDVLLCLEGVGAFAIEVKAVTLDAIESCGAGEMVLSSRERNRQHPLAQAKDAMWYFRDRLVRYHEEDSVEQRKLVPYFSPLAAFPKISRAEFFARFGDDPLVAGQRNMIFAEDLQSGSALKERLQAVILDPPIGASRPPGWELQPQQIAFLISALQPDGKLGPSPAERLRAKVVDNPDAKARNRIRDYLEPSSHPPVFFRGYPGTGKTMVLLQIACAHARSGRQVLFTCYNKVLASDIRRLLCATNLEPADLARIEVVHAAKLLARNCTYVRSREAELVRKLCNSAERPDRSYDTVCIDEGQDLGDWAYDLVDWYADRHNTEWFIADGPGQELYLEQPGARLTELRETAKSHKSVMQLNRVYRTAQVDFLVAQGVFEYAPERAKIANWVEQHPLPAPKLSEQQVLFSSPLDLEFDTHGLLPKVVSFRTRRQGDTQAGSLYAALLELIPRELEAAELENRPGDLAILVYNVRRTDDISVVRSVLSKLNVPYTDHHRAKIRNESLEPGKVRVVSFHSARGIEAHRTILIGFDELGDQWHGKQLAYVVLSRAKASTTVMLQEGRRAPYSMFLRELIAEYSRQR